MARPKRETPWLDRRDNGRFYAQWYDPSRRHVVSISLRTTDLTEAETRFAEFLLNGREIRNARPAGEISVARALDDYYEEHVLAKCAAARRQMDAIRNLKEWFGPKFLLSDVDVPTSQAYANARYAGEIGGGSRRKIKTASPATVRRELNVLVAAANHALWMKRTKSVISVDLPPERRLGQDDEAPYYSTEEVERIFAEAARMDAERLAAPRDDGNPPRPDLEAYMRLLYQTGARRRSIELLTRGQVKLREKRLLLQPPGKRTTKKRQPIVPILKGMEAPLAHLLEGNRDRLFEYWDYYRPYRECCRRAGIDEARCHPHIMRHTRATHLLQEGKSLYNVAKLLGDTVATIERVYGHHSHDHLAAGLED